MIYLPKFPTTYMQLFEAIFHYDQYVYNFQLFVQLQR